MNYDISKIGARHHRETMAGRAGRVLVNRTADTLCGQSLAASETDVDKIAASIRKWGWTNPVLVDEHGVVIAGHLRVAAAARLGLKSLPVIVARGWSEEEK